MFERCVLIVISMVVGMYVSKIYIGYNNNDEQVCNVIGETLVQYSAEGSTLLGKRTRIQLGGRRASLYRKE